jgi:hypothetical protein
MRKSPTPVEQEVPMLILKHSRFRGRNVVINATVFSFDMEGIARVKDLGSARDDLEALLRRDAQVKVIHDPRNPALPVPPSINEVLKAGYSQEAAEQIVAREKDRAAKGLHPYGDTPEPEPVYETAVAQVPVDVAENTPTLMAEEVQSMTAEPIEQGVPEAQVAQEPTVPQKKPEVPLEAPEAQVEVAAPATEEPVRQPVVKQRRRINKE